MPTADDDGDALDAQLAPLHPRTPARIREWLLPSVLLGLAAAAVIVGVVTIGARGGLHALGWATVTAAVLVIVDAVTLGALGHRAWLRLTPRSVGVYLRFTVSSRAGVVAVALVLGSLAGLGIVLYPAAVIGVSGLRARPLPLAREAAELERRLRRTTTRAALLNAVIMIVLPVTLGLVVRAQRTAPNLIEQAWTVQAVILPAVGLALGAWALLRLRASDTRAHVEDAPDH
ncbi:MULTISPECIES: hypothetical protein [unclassified Curtobacterium]|uniref:hypothetical protein n=1 Tax=unclassified Curtobacterium TaxID=257496 RepID=UPI000DAA6024|nr:MULTISPECIES: hypothetical protein [unclassified Curtobacterium]WIB66916.1 hypothetical protein DEI93_13265 [Curtobacterium sp. MCBD17_035]WIE54061.1 hypothetical protein DEI88_013175 [Curtobacterium sp. MCBD17_003]